MSVAQLTSAEQLARLPDAERFELVRGELKPMSPGGPDHGEVASQLGMLLRQFVVKARLGRVPICDTGFILSRNPDTVLGPDVAFIAKQRVAEMLVAGSGFYVGPPDLAVEIISPSNSAQEIEDKVADYLDAGTRLVWVIYPKRKTVRVYRPGGKSETLGESDELTGEDVVPGFRCQVSQIFDY